MYILLSLYLSIAHRIDLTLSDSTDEDSSDQYESQPQPRPVSVPSQSLSDQSNVAAPSDQSTVSAPSDQSTVSAPSDQSSVSAQTALSTQSSECHFCCLPAEDMPRPMRRLLCCGSQSGCDSCLMTIIHEQNVCPFCNKEHFSSYVSYSP